MDTPTPAHINLAYRHLMTNENGLEIRQLMAQPKVTDKNNKIQVLTIGKENTKPTKAFLLIGQTGAGKTTLLNGMINYFMKSKFEENFRYSVKDETGSELKGCYQSQTEFVTAYLVYHQPGMAVQCNFMIIDTPGFGDTRGKEQQKLIKKQMEMFLYDDKYNVNELHCLGFVVNGTINRSHKYLQEIVTDFESLFGKDTINITKILATHTDDESPAISKVLEDLKIKADKLYTFDNGILFANNRGKRVKMGQMKWQCLEEQYDEFFEDMLVASSGSLKLSKEAIGEKMKLERSLLMLRRQIDNRVKALLETNSTKRLHRKYSDCVKSNQSFEGEETYTVTNTKEITGRFTHAHNCPSCNQTCVYPCTTLKSMFCSCPSGTCEVCPCDAGDHVNSGHTIEKSLKSRKVTNAAMKDSFEEAKKKMVSTEAMLAKLEKDAGNYLQQMAVFIKQTINHITRINEISRNPNPKAPEEHIGGVIEDIRNTMLREITDPLDKEYLTEVLLALPGQVDQVVLKETKHKTGIREKFMAIVKA